MNINNEINPVSKSRLRERFFMFIVNNFGTGFFNMKTKYCRKCKKTKELSEFYKYKNNKDGCNYWCKKCTDDYNKKWMEKNKEKRKIYNRKYQREKLRNNLIYRLSHNIRKSVWYSLKGNKNGKHWEDLVGYTQEDLRRHLEKQFKDGMNWSNYGKWHLDHIIPMSLFNITGVKSKGFKKCWALENLQPLWEKDNFKKHNKLFK